MNLLSQDVRLSEIKIEKNSVNITLLDIRPSICWAFWFLGFKCVVLLVRASLGLR